MTCQIYKDRLHELEEYVEGRLDASRTAEMTAHLNECPNCRETVEAAAAAGRILREARAPAGNPAETFWTRLGAQLREEEERRLAVGDFWGALERLAWRFSMGTAVVVLVLAGYLVTQGPVEHSPETAERREIFQEPEQPQNQDEVLITLANRGNGGKP